MNKRPYGLTEGQWLARSILSGFFVAPIEALPEVSVTDVVRVNDATRYLHGDRELTDGLHR